MQARLAAINGAAQVLRTRQADVTADYVLGIGGFDLSRIGDEVRRPAWQCDCFNFVHAPARAPSSPRGLVWKHTVMQMSSFECHPW